MARRSHDSNSKKAKKKASSSSSSTADGSGGRTSSRIVWLFMIVAVGVIIFVSFYLVNYQYLNPQFLSGSGSNGNNGIPSATSTSSEAPASSQEALNYVVFSVSVGSSARNMDYTYLTPLVARNWFLMGGFRPIVFVVYAQHAQPTVDAMRKLWEIILPRETILIPVIVQEEWHSVSFAQLSRLFGPTVLLDNNNDDDDDDTPNMFMHPSAFVRVTDADMLILNARPFKPPKNRTIDITIFNGKCCLGNYAVGGDGKKCNQYPMHSVGMKANLWRTLFPIMDKKNMPTQQQQQQAIGDTNSSSNNRNQEAILAARSHAMVRHLYDVINSTFPDYFLKQTKTGHGGRNWIMDQLLLGCAVDDASNRDGYNLELAPGPTDRLHVNGQQPYVTDVHLAKFSLNTDRMWMDELVTNSKLLTDYNDEYHEYTDQWIEWINKQQQR